MKRNCHWCQEVRQPIPNRFGHESPWFYCPHCDQPCKRRTNSGECLPCEKVDKAIAPQP